LIYIDNKQTKYKVIKVKISIYLHDFFTNKSN